jgi:hypothetical protein
MLASHPGRRLLFSTDDEGRCGHSGEWMLQQRRELRKPVKRNMPLDAIFSSAENRLGPDRTELQATWRTSGARSARGSTPRARSRSGLRGVPPRSVGRVLTAQQEHGILSCSPRRKNVPQEVLMLDKGP